MGLDREACQGPSIFIIRDSEQTKAQGAAKEQTFFKEIQVLVKFEIQVSIRYSSFGYACSMVIAVVILVA